MEHRKEKKNIVYLDETCFDSHDVIEKGWTNGSTSFSLDVPPSRGKRIIILHAGNENGFVKNGLLLSAKNIKGSAADYHSDMNSELFEKWFENTLLPNIAPNSVIVMDNATYHSRQLRKIPTLGNKKQEILSFLNGEGVTTNPKETKKKQLIDRVKALNFEKTFVVDELAGVKGHQVLRLPPYYCQFNPIEYVWSKVKNELRKNNLRPRLNGEIVSNVRKIIEELETKSETLWQNCIVHVISKEQEYARFKQDTNLIIDLHNSDSDSESDTSQPEF